MSRRIHAILTVLMAAALVIGRAPACAQDDDGAASISVDPPRPVSFRLADGVRIGGALSEWSAVDCDGTFGRRRWSALMPDDVAKVIRRVMDTGSAEHWVMLGAALLRVGADASADRAFTQAVRLDERARVLVDRARDEVRVIREEEEARRAAIEAELLSTRSPEARDWPSSPWPALSASEQEQALLAVRGEADRMLRDAGVSFAPIDATNVIVYSDLERREAAVLARRLDQIHQRLVLLLGLAADVRLPYGKTAVFVFKDSDRFRLVETQAFDHLPARGITAVAHCIGPIAFVNSWREADGDAFVAQLAHQTVHAFMHRYRSPRRLPAWANDGLADFVAASVIDDSFVDRRLRPLALQYVRGGGDVLSILDQSYRGDWWPGPEQLGPAIGHLMVELMTIANHRGFVAWVDAVKAGKDWQQALREDYGLSRRGLVRLFLQYYRVND